VPFLAAILAGSPLKGGLPAELGGAGGVEEASYGSGNSITALGGTEPLAAALIEYTYAD